MNKTKIDWATMSWNPVTGCRHGCPYCYARRTAHRFDAGCADPDPLADGLHVLEEKIKATPYPYGFEPTMHRYRLNQPERQAEPQTIFVCSMADLFGRWVPTSWIAEVLDACRRAPQHRYLFLTKNPARYLQLDYMGLLPHENNFWYGSTVANEDAAAMYTMQGVAINSFWSMEPLLGPVDMSAAEGLPQWVILGAETGNRADKVTPRREWVDWITQFCAENEIPVFYKAGVTRGRNRNRLHRGERAVAGRVGKFARVWPDHGAEPAEHEQGRTRTGGRGRSHGGHYAGMYGHRICGGVCRG